jgi:hypothetical protein
MKTLIFIILAFFQLSANAITNVVFVNGIDGSAQKSINSVGKLNEIINIAGLGDKFQTIEGGIYHWYNSGDGFFDDKVELLKQASISAQALITARNAIPGATAQSSIYKATLGQLYTTAINNGVGDTEEDVHVYSTVKELASFINLQLADGRKLIVVAHSQGNFISEAVDAYLRYGRSIAENKIYDDNLRFVGAASVAASSPNGRYLSAEEDQALSLHRVATLGVIPFTVQSPNVRLCNNFILRGTCHLLLEWVDLTIHGFQEIYTSTQIDKISGKSLADILVGFINVSFDELSVCSAATVGTTGYSLVFKGCSAANVAEYYDKTECVRDNVTGLIWEGKPTTGFRTAAFTNFDSTVTHQDFSYPTTPVLQSQIDASTNSIGFRNAVNAIILCGFSNWRMPNKDELFGLVKINTVAPMIDVVWFPNTALYRYRSSTSMGRGGSNDPLYDGASASIDFRTGIISNDFASFNTGRNAVEPVRLVR